MSLINQLLILLGLIFAINHSLFSLWNYFLGKFTGWKNLTDALLEREAKNVLWDETEPGWAISLFYDRNLLFALWPHTTRLTSIKQCLWPVMTANQWGKSKQWNQRFLLFVTRKENGEYCRWCSHVEKEKWQQLQYSNWSFELCPHHFESDQSLHCLKRKIRPTFLVNLINQRKNNGK